MKILIQGACAHRVVFAACFITLAACGGGSDHGPAVAESPVPIRTLAYVFTECREQHGVAIWSQALRVRTGDRPPVTALSIDPVSVSAPGFCEAFATEGFGHSSLVAGAFQRLGVSPDGSGVVFEVTTAFAVLPIGQTVEEGMFYVRADGTGLRRLAPASREAPFRTQNLELRSLESLLAFSPDGARVTYMDLGPGPSDEDALQIFTLDISTGVRSQITHLPNGPIRDVNRPTTFSPFFLDNRRIAFFTTANPEGLNPESDFRGFTVARDGTDLRAASLPIAVPGSELIPNFAITGPEPSAVLLPGENELVIQNGFAILDVFLLDGDNLLQLTDYRRNDITDALVSADGQRVFFNASVDPLQENPSQNCQLFSINRTGGDLHQLTHFSEGDRSFAGCYFVPRPYGCEINFLFQDPVNQTLVFYSNCNPLGANPNGGQIFAMRRDGTGLRQLTDARGLATEADGTVVAQLPGPFAYSSRTSRSQR